MPTLRSSPDKGTPESVSMANEATRGSRAPNPAVAADLLSPEERHERICRAAYRRAQDRGFISGGELEDWLLAEREVDNVSEG